MVALWSMGCLCLWFALSLQSMCHVAYAGGMIALIVVDDWMRAALGRLLVQAGYDAVCGVYGLGGEIASDAAIVRVGGVDSDFAAPVRLGAVIDRIALMAARLQADRHIDMGEYCLQLSENVIVRAGGDGIVLTDTEVRLLTVLAEAGGVKVARDDLLAKVWGYRADIDTHTVETHIYRLRQKIEVDASAPQFILTEAAGYRLNI